MEAYEADAKRASELSALAMTTHEDALRKKQHAVEEHMRATEEVLRTEAALKEASDKEEHRHVSSAAAAAARTRQNLTQASMLKATETAALARARYAAEEEALALAQLQLCEERVRNAREIKFAAEREATLAQEECRKFTQAAANTAAELDAHTNAATAVRAQGVKAETLFQAAMHEHEIAKQMVTEEHATTHMVHQEAGVTTTTLREFVDGRTVAAHTLPVATATIPVAAATIPAPEVTTRRALV